MTNLSINSIQAQAALPYSQACENNKAPILEKLRVEFADTTQVLEVGSGTGQHAVYFAEHLPHLQWQTSDVPANHDFINAWISAYPATNLQHPIPLDLQQPIALSQQYDAVFTANTLHIIAWELVIALFDLVGETLTVGGKLCIYGPFKYDGEFTSASNQQFDSSLRSRDVNSGIRDIEAIIVLANSQQLSLVSDQAMPANNRLLTFIKK